MDEWVIEADTEYCVEYGFFDVKEDLIRCKDCRHAVNEPDRDGSDVWICNYNHWRRAEGIRCPDGFCSEGDRREDGRD